MTQRVQFRASSLWWSCFAGFASWYRAAQAAGPSCRLRCSTGARPFLQRHPFMRTFPMKKTLTIVLHLSNQC